MNNAWRLKETETVKQFQAVVERLMTQYSERSKSWDFSNKDPVIQIGTELYYLNRVMSSYIRVNAGRSIAEEQDRLQSNYFVYEELKRKCESSLEGIEEASKNYHPNTYEYQIRYAWITLVRVFCRLMDFIVTAGKMAYVSATKGWVAGQQVKPMYQDPKRPSIFKHPRSSDELHATYNELSKAYQDAIAKIDEIRPPAPVLGT